MENERSRVNYQMSQEDMKLQAIRQQKRESDETERIKRLQQRDEQIGAHYDRVHRRLMGL